MFSSASGDSHKFGCVMLYLPKDMASQVHKWGEANVPDEWLTGDGRETEMHVTVLYGLKPELELKDVEASLPKSSVAVELGEISRFDTSPDFDVIKVEVEGDDLHEAHWTLAELPNEDPHAEKYQPHVTIAYVKKGKGKELDGSRPFDGLKLKLSDLVWSPAGEGDDRKKHIDLGKNDKVSRLLGASRVENAPRGIPWLWAPWFNANRRR
jgi:2'-5' RNA ligase